MCVCVCVFVSTYTCRAAVRHKRVQRSNGRERQIAHTQINHIITHTHAAAEWVYSTTKSKRKQNKKPKRGTTSAHTLSLLP
ncbi:hypothetical protein TCDM_09468 [Trypanosoma cruzi Dm28c]|uniref:Uncharacterized protein n=1 Tax=Trypanosoma cruzi Dm28c TaxID=1416333 RepID=V5B9U9_TRYCR|nr:hypothetical protein TCDM_09468 [Trypanosoma cruzi Dm28c]